MSDLPFPLKGINYYTGTEFMPGELSRALWSPTDLKRDLAAIATAWFKVIDSEPESIVWEPQQAQTTVAFIYEAW